MRLIKDKRLGPTEAIAAVEARQGVARLRIVAEKQNPARARWLKIEATAFGNVKDKLAGAQKNAQSGKLKR